MTARSHCYGHKVTFDEQRGSWCYDADGARVTSAIACQACGLMSTILNLSGRPIEVDACIAPIVQALNDAGAVTRASCCGHGRRAGNIALADGREVLICPDYDASRRVDEAIGSVRP